MATTATVHVRRNEHIKAQATETPVALKVPNAETRIAIAEADEIIRKHRERFATELSAPLIPNETTIQAMKDARAGRVKKAANLDALFRDLNANT